VDCDTAAIERLEAEKRRRQDEKVAKGEAVRVQFIPPVVRPDEVADAVIVSCASGVKRGKFSSMTIP
jgi:hypothetical protein